MAKLFPDIENIKRLKVPPTSGEWSLINDLTNSLSDDIEIYFQPYLNGDMPDIILMKKNAGVAIIEVKDWNLNSYFLNNNNEWVLKKNNVKIFSPFRQLFRYKDNMFNLHINGLLEKKTMDKRFYGRINAYVFFTNATKQELRTFYVETINFLSDSIKQCPRSDNKKLTKLVNKLNKTIKQRDFYAKGKNDIKSMIIPKISDYLFDDSIYLEFKRYLQPPFHTKEQGIDVFYTEKQSKLCISNAKHQKVKGVAGSGKSLVLAKRAVNAHKRHGGKVLILTFNITLVSYIHDMINKVREDFSWDVFTILNYHNYFTIMANNCELEISGFPDYYDLNFFDHSSVVKYKSIFIDEIQDYDLLWIKIIKKYFLEENGEFVVYGDEKQNIYNIKLNDDKKPNTTIVGDWSILSESFRLGKKIANLAEKFQKEYFTKKYDIDNINIPKQLSLLPDRGIIESITINHNEPNEILNTVFQLIKKHNIHPNDICILGYKIEILRHLDTIIKNDYNEKTMITFETEEEYNSIKDNTIHKENVETILNNLRRVKKFSFKLNNGMLKLSTIQSFKGWESPTVFLLINDDPEEAVYTGITRARENLFLLNHTNTKFTEFFNN